jgi:hypothetical protein
MAAALTATLETVPLEAEPSRPPADVRRLLRAANRRIDRFKWERGVPAFVPSDFGLVYAGLRSLEASGLVSGRWFCEWGSGLGVVCCLATMLGFDAWGIEVDAGLVAAARRLAARFELPAEFARGSYVPRGAEGLLDSRRGYSWLGVAPSGYEAAGVGLDEFDLIFAYPWPDEERLVTELFARYAQPGAMLLTYHPSGELRLRRKASRAAG